MGVAQHGGDPPHNLLVEERLEGFGHGGLGVALGAPV
jgi:hypothetical protein